MLVPIIALRLRDFRSPEAGLMQHEIKTLRRFFDDICAAQRGKESRKATSHLMLLHLRRLIAWQLISLVNFVFINLLGQLGNIHKKILTKHVTSTSLLCDTEMKGKARPL